MIHCESDGISREGSKDVDVADYFRYRSIKDDFKELCDPKLSFKADRKEANELILNFLIKYLLVYCGDDDLSFFSKEEWEVFKDYWKGDEEDSLLKGEIDIAAKKIERKAPHPSGARRQSDHVPLQCAGDILQTAAIFKEIMFNKAFKKGERFFGLDLGSGTGILTLAMLVAARRKNIENILCVGVEGLRMAVENSRNTIGLLTDNGVVRGGK